MHGDEFKLASLDFMGTTAELEAKAKAAVIAAGSDFTPPPRQEGADGSGAVRVTVDRQGTVVEVQIGREWRDKLKAAEFPAALLAAYHAAAARAIEVEGLARLVAEQSMTPQEREAQERQRSAQVRAGLDYSPPEDDRAWLAATWGKIYELDEKLHNLSRPDPTEQQQTRVPSPQGYLVLTHRGTTITAITGDAERIAAADQQRLRTEALAIFRVAQHAARPAAPQEGK